MGFVEEFYASIINAFSSGDTGDTLKKIWHALDPQKWGSPITKGEAHYINDVIVDEVYHGYYDQTSVLSFATLYDEELEEGFAWARRGWVADYIADSFMQNSFKKVLFLLAVRTGEVGKGIVESIETAEREPGSADSMLEKFWAVFWATLFFNFATIIIGAVSGGIQNVFDPALWPIMFAFYFSYIKWYGKYGMYLPIIGEQGFISAIASVVLMVSSARVALGIIPFVKMSMFPVFIQPSSIPIIGVVATSLIWLYLLYKFLQIMMPLLWIPALFSSPIWAPLVLAFLPAIGSGINGLMIPNPVFLGLGPLFMDGNMQWSMVLLLWGLSGVVNVYYAEWLKSEEEESMEQAYFHRELKKWFNKVN